MPVRWTLVVGPRFALRAKVVLPDKGLVTSLLGLEVSHTDPVHVLSATKERTILANSARI